VSGLPKVRDYGVAYDARNASLTDLYKHVADVLSLSRDAVPDNAKGSTAAHKVLQNLSTAVQPLAELRNALGTGRGRTAPNPALARHARLAANASRTAVGFVLETWHERKAAGG
jgi:abortive infection Abi-like protein